MKLTDKTIVRVNVFEGENKFSYIDSDASGRILVNTTLLQSYAAAENFLLDDINNYQESELTTEAKDDIIRILKQARKDVLAAGPNDEVTFKIDMVDYFYEGNVNNSYEVVVNAQFITEDETVKDLDEIEFNLMDEDEDEEEEENDEEFEEDEDE